MGCAIYNSAIPGMDHRAVSVAPTFRVALLLMFAFSIHLREARAADWTAPAQQLAQKIAAVTGPGAVAFTLENRSSLSRRESDTISKSLRADLEAHGIHFVDSEQAAATLTIALSENSSSYVWVVEIRQGSAEPTVVMVTTARGDGASFTHASTPITLRRIPLWTQEERILDVAVLEEGAVPSQIAVLDGEKVGLYRWHDGRWEQEQTVMLTHVRPWPRDLRGRVIPAKDHLLDVYLPGIFCRSNTNAPLSLNCRESDDPWPLVASSVVGSSGGTVFPSFGVTGNTAPTVPAMSAFYAPTRNFFTGALAPGVGKFKTVSKFYSAAPLPREKYALWLFASVDGQVHMLDGVTDLAARVGWGSDLASIRTPCGAGWQLLAAKAGDQTGDAIRAYEIPDRDPVPVSAALDLQGDLTALWAEARGDSAVAVVRSRETGTYDAFRLAVTCNQ